MEKCKVSIITVVYNDAEGLKKTFDSIIKQTGEIYECVVVDGGSKDNSVNVIKFYQREFEEQGVKLTYVSEKDKGIYDAMNKGIRMAIGEWCIFMNAGDWFYSEKVLENVFEKKQYDGIGVVYGRWVTVMKDKVQEGNVFLVDEKDQEEYAHLKCTKKFPKIGKMISSHQAVFFRTELMKERNYNIQYRIVADFEWCMYAYLNGIKFKFVDEFICKFDFGGVSSIKLYEKNKESVAVRHSYGVQDNWFVEKAKLFVWFVLEKLVRSFWRN